MKIKMEVRNKINFGISRLQGELYGLMLRPLGLMNWLCRSMPMINSRGGTSMSLDGSYLIGWSWKGLIYLIEMGLGAPVVTSFVVHPKPWGAQFSKDMQQIIITHGAASRTILSASPAEGFSRRKFPVVQEWITGDHTPRNIVELISHTSSAYWKYEADPNVPVNWLSPNPFPLPPTDLDCDWEEWVAHGERYLDLPSATCGNDG